MSALPDQVPSYHPLKDWSFIPSSGVVCLNGSHRHAVDLERKLQVGSFGIEYQVVMEDKVGVTIHTDTSDEVLRADLSQVRSQLAAHLDLWTGVGRCHRGLGIEELISEEEISHRVVLLEGPLEWELDGLVALQILALVNVPSELDVMSFVSCIS